MKLKWISTMQCILVGGQMNSSDRFHLVSDEIRLVKQFFQWTMSTNFDLKVIDALDWGFLLKCL